MQDHAHFQHLVLFFYFFNRVNWGIRYLGAEVLARRWWGPASLNGTASKDHRHNLLFFWWFFFTQIFLTRTFSNVARLRPACNKKAWAHPQLGQQGGGDHKRRHLTEDLKRWGHTSGATLAHPDLCPKKTGAGTRDFFFLFFFSPGRQVSSEGPS